MCLIIHVIIFDQMFVARFKQAKLRRTCGAILYNIDEFLQASDEHYVVSDASIKNWNKKHDESSHPLSKVPETSTISEEKSKRYTLKLL